MTKDPDAAAGVEPELGFALVHFRPGPAWIPDRDVFDQPLDEHVRFIATLVRTGQVMLAGPLGDGTGGLTILHAHSPAQASDVIAADPAVVAGILTYEVAWWCPLAVDDRADVRGYHVAPLRVVAAGAPRERALRR
jgi:uncharacterized protein YciI